MKFISESEYLQRFIQDEDRDWAEDAEHENGNYWNKCGGCGVQFIGHKRRVRCKKCANQEH